MSSSTAAARQKSALTSSIFNPRYTFASFVVGSSNEFAASASRLVAEKPFNSYNPLFLYGAGGLGKTHLLHAIGHLLGNLNGHLKLMCVSSQRFATELEAALHENKLPAFREHYCSADVLFFDDIQFIAGADKPQEEFLRTFNWLYELNKLIVISADALPRAIPGLDGRLHTRLEWGLTADIQPPDFDTRIEIVKRKAATHEKKIPDNVAHFIAGNIRFSVRELEGAIVRVIAYSMVKHVDITLPLVHEVLRDWLNMSENQISIEKIQRTIAEYFTLRLQDLKSKTQLKKLTRPRQISMYLCRQLTTASLPRIAREFDKHHTTVMSAVAKIERDRLRDKALNELIETLSKSLQTRPN